MNVDAKITPAKFFAPSLDQSGMVKYQMANYFLNSGETPASQTLKDYVDYDTLQKNAQYTSTSPTDELFKPASISDLSGNALPASSNSSNNSDNSISLDNSTQSKKAASYANYLTNNGKIKLTRIAAAGVVGNFMSESGLNTTRVGDHGTSYGLGQWHNDRWDNLKSFASSNGLDINDPKTQLDFAVNELGTKYKGVLNDINNASTPQEAARIFAFNYEHMAPSTYNSDRPNNAAKIYNSSI